MVKTEDDVGTTQTRPSNDHAAVPRQAKGRLSNPAQRRLSPTDIDDLISAYQAGATINQLAVKFGIHRTTVAAHLDRRGIPRHNDHTAWSDEKLRQGAELYTTGLTLADVANHRQPTPTRRRRRAGLAARSGDGVLALLPSATSAVNAARHLRERLAGDELGVRIGIHVGEIDRRGDDVSGLAISIAARVMAQAEDGQIVTSAIVTELTDCVGLAPIGSRLLKGIEGEWSLYVVDDRGTGPGSATTDAAVCDARRVTDARWGAP